MSIQSGRKSGFGQRAPHRERVAQLRPELAIARIRLYSERVEQLSLPTREPVQRIAVGNDELEATADDVVITGDNFGGSANGETGGYRWRVDIAPFDAGFVDPRTPTPWVPQAVVIRAQSPSGQQIQINTVRLRKRAQ